MSKPTTLDAFAKKSTRELTGERFIPSGIRHPKYKGTRIRRLEFAQVDAIEAGLDRFDITSRDELRSQLGKDPKAKFKVMGFLQACLVSSEKPSGPATLFRGGDHGLARMMQQITTDELFECICRAFDQVDLLPESESEADGDEDTTDDDGGEEDDTEGSPDEADSTPE
ncbi:MAG: hypothetical protein AAFU85_11570 [Planctomycetota bacterium]